MRVTHTFCFHFCPHLRIAYFSFCISVYSRFCAMDLGEWKSGKVRMLWRKCKKKKKFCHFTKWKVSKQKKNLKQINILCYQSFKNQFLHWYTCTRYEKILQDVWFVVSQVMHHSKTEHSNQVHSSYDIVDFKLYFKLFWKSTQKEVILRKDGAADEKHK